MTPRRAMWTVERVSPYGESPHEMGGICRIAMRFECRKTARCTDCRDKLLRRYRLAEK